MIPTAAGRRDATYATVTARLAANVTGSPDSACSATRIASAMLRRHAGRSRTRSVVHRIHGRNATHQDRFGKFSVDTIGPPSAKTIAPSALPAGPCERRRKQNVPSAAMGSGSATHKLNATTSGGRSRIASVTGISNWFSASATADCPAPM